MLRKFTNLSVLFVSIALSATACSKTSSSDEATAVSSEEEVALQTNVDEVPSTMTTAMVDLSAGDATAGKAVYARCGACHAPVAGRNGVGPSLYGVVGRRVGSVEGFNYSTAMKESDVIWTPENLNSHLADIKGFIPGNRMATLYPAGVPDEQDRANLIAYMATLTDE